MAAILGSTDIRTPLESLMQFTLPDTDLGVVQSTRTVTIRPDQQQYVPGDHMLLNIQSSTHMLDPTKSYMKFRIQIVDSSGNVIPEAGLVSSVTTAASANARLVATRRAYILSAGAGGLIKSLRIQTETGATLEQINDYNTFGALVDKWTLSQEMKENELAGEGWLPEPRASENIDVSWMFAQSGANTTSSQTQPIAVDANYTKVKSTNLWGAAFRLRRYTERFQGYMVGNYKGEISGTDLTYRFRHSGILGGAKAIPLPWIGRLGIDVEWESAMVAFRQMQWRMPYTNYDSTSASPSLLGHQLVPLGTTLKKATSAKTAGTALETETMAADAITYNISKVEFVAHLIRPAPAMREALDAAAAGDGIPFPIDTPFTTSSTHVGASAVTDSATDILDVMQWTISKSAANVKSVFTYYQPRGTALESTLVNTAMEGAINSFRFIKPGAINWKYELGTMSYPDFNVNSDVIGLEFARQAIPTRINSKLPSVPLERYSYAHLSQVGGLPISLYGAKAGTSAWTEDGKAQQAVNFKTPYHAQDAGVDAYCQGIMLQTSEGVDLSGKSTNAGSQLVLKSRYNESYTALDTNGNYTETNTNLDDGRGANIRVLHTIIHTKLILFLANRQAIIKE